MDAPAVRKWRSSGGRGRRGRCDHGRRRTRIGGGANRGGRHFGWYRVEERAFLAATGEHRNANHYSNKAMPENKSVKAT